MTEKPSVTRRTKYLGEASLTLRAGRYQAVVLPTLGANLISWVDVENNWQFMREPDAHEAEAFKKKPSTYGIPVLFPPNRYADGRFTVAGETYQFPINEPDSHNFIHGCLYHLPWEVRETGATRNVAYVILRQRVDDGHPLYAYFPHRFNITLTYLLSSGGLRGAVRVHNLGHRPMPVMLGFHTALRVPFASDSRSDDMRVRVAIGHRWELDQRHLPTGIEIPLSPLERTMRDVGVSPFAEPMDNHYSANLIHGRHSAIVTDTRLGVELVYTVGRQYRYWMLWNDGARGGFFCAEPQTNMVNAPNISRPLSETGVVLLKPGQSFREFSQLHVRSQQRDK